MKIKCPDCNIELTEDKFYKILLNMHWDKLQEYEKLKSKIHEKIEHWEGHGISLDLDSDDVVKELKSLLEDK